MAQRKCEKCGYLLSDTDQFCPKCGQAAPVDSISTDAKKASQTAAQTFSQIGDSVSKTASKISKSPVWKNLLNVLKGIFTKPQETLKECSGANYFISGIICIAVCSLLSLLIVGRLVGLFFNIFSASFGTLLGGLSIQLGFGFYLSSLLIILACFALSILIIWLADNFLFKGKVSFKNITAGFGACSVVLSAGLLVSWLMTFINAYLFLFVFLFTTIFYLYLIYLMVATVSTMKPTVILYLVTITSVIVIFICLGLHFNSLSSSLNSMKIFY